MAFFSLKSQIPISISPLQLNYSALTDSLFLDPGDWRHLLNTLLVWLGLKSGMWPIRLSWQSTCWHINIFVNIDTCYNNILLNIDCLLFYHLIARQLVFPITFFKDMSAFCNYLSFCWEASLTCLERDFRMPMLVLDLTHTF